jgi:7-cyano-7-deazaguanine synthase
MRLVFAALIKKEVMMTRDAALVLFSGGQDSTTCLAWALDRFERVETLGFDYGQRHAIELAMRPQLLAKLRAQRPDWDARLGEDHMIDLGLISQLSQTAMTEDIEITMQANGLPNTFVPGRNLMFMTVAATLAYRRGLNVLVGGMCETDFSGYPDCRDDTMKALQVALNLGMDTRNRLETPLMWLDKAQTWELAEDLGGQPLVDLIRADTHTCYKGERGALHDWGYGCGECPACALRARGYENYVARKAA